MAAAYSARSSFAGESRAGGHQSGEQAAGCRLATGQLTEPNLPKTEPSQPRPTIPLVATSLRRSLAGLDAARDPVTGFTCLHHAALNGHSQCVRLLLDHGARVNAVDYKGSSALHLAAWAGNLQVVRILLAGHSPPDVCVVASSSRPEEIDVDLRNNDNQSPLSLAAQFGHNQVVGELLGRSASVHLRNNQLESPLDLAALNGRLETCRLLLDCSPELRSQLRAASSTLRVARAGGDLLPQAGSPPSLAGRHQRRPSGSGWATLLRNRSRQPDPAGLSAGGRSTLAQTGLDPVAPGEPAALRKAALANGRLLLLHQPAACLESAGSQQEALLEVPLEHSPLHYAVRRDHLHLVRLLLEDYQANVMQTTTSGSVLHELALSASARATGEQCGQLLSQLFSSLMQMAAHPAHAGELAARQKSSRPRLLESLERFLGLRDGRGRDVFEVLEEINNRSAQEIKRLIYEFSELVRRQQNTTQAQQGGQQVSAGRPDHSQQQQQQHQVNHSASQQNKQQQLFSDSQQINSFVTMKRVPKQQLGPQTMLADATGGRSNGYLFANQFPATQTIDRRRTQRQRPATNEAHHSSRPVEFGFGLASGSGQQHQLLTDQQLVASMTRSVSNLAALRGPPKGSLDDWRRSQQVAGRGSPEASRKRRSKSRDLGSLLQEANQRAGHLLSCSEPAERQDPASSALVRSQTDCSHLMGRHLFADSTGNWQMLRPLHNDQMQPQHATLDRKTINRHYHVYEHQFYPPRLINQPERQQAVAIVMPLGRSESTGASFASSPKADLKLSPGPPLEPLPEPADQQQVSTGANRHSLNFGSDWRQMDRFVGRSSARKSSANPRTEPVEPRQPTETAPGEHLHNSQSLESHLSEPHLFESTRQALMRDFDQLIGRELLNRDLCSTNNHGPANSQDSILTGVSLDMDTRGECLTVSGTRLTLPAPIEDRKQAEGARRSPAAGSTVSQPTSRTLSGAPRKPPRPSLRSFSSFEQHRASSAASTSSSSSSVIYDLPTSQPTGPSGPQVAAALLTSQIAPTIQNSSSPRVASITRPPCERPPPPPPPVQVSAGELPVTSQLNIGVGHSLDQATGGSPKSSASSTMSQAEAQAQADLLKLGSLTSNSSSSSSSVSNSISRTRLRPVRPPLPLGRHLMIQSEWNDGDSGVCTSNSPASLSHDSMGPLAGGQIHSIEEQQAMDSSRSLVAAAPPSPNTAQCSIEEALMPLDEVSVETRVTDPDQSMPQTRF